MSEIIYLYISRAKDDTVAENLLIYVYPPYTFTEIKYIYLTPILHTYTSHSIRRHTLYTSSTQPIRVYAYRVDTHWHAAHFMGYVEDIYRVCLRSIRMDVTYGLEDGS